MLGPTSPARGHPTRHNPEILTLGASLAGLTLGLPSARKRRYGAVASSVHVSGFSLEVLVEGFPADTEVTGYSGLSFPGCYTLTQLGGLLC